MNQTVTEMQTELDAISAQIRANIAEACSRSAASEVNAPLKHRAAVLEHMITIETYTIPELRETAIAEVRGIANTPGFDPAAAREALEILGV